ncbi:hypothetical protein [Pseudohalioglobus lutimaris]|nr:hypothetical protein [Pseudohalioglobus lutimaris]
MPRPLTFTLLLVALVTACAEQPVTPIASRPKTTVIAAPSSGVDRWLSQYGEVKVMGRDEIVTALLATGRPSNSQQFYYFGLLNQELTTLSNWTLARDAFRQIQDDTELSPEQRELASILERYNQTRLNDYERQDSLQSQQDSTQSKLDNALEENALLKQKIQAITDLETSISTREGEGVL